MNVVNYADVRGTHDVPSFHDAEIVSIGHHSEDRELVMSLKRVRGETGVFRFTRVIAQRIVDFSEQNVVSRLLISPRYPFSSDEVRTWVQWVNSREDAKAAPVDGQLLDQYMHDFMTGQRALFILEPSCGAEMAVLCESIWLKS